MSAVDDEGDPPPELLLSWECSRYNVLPDAGGVYDQEWALLYRMRIATNIYNALSKLRNAKGKEIHRLTDGERAIIKWLIDEKVING